VESAREALVVWFTKIKEIDKNAIIYPWTAMDRKNKAKCLEKPSDIPFLLSNMKKSTFTSYTFDPREVHITHRSWWD